MATQIVIDTNVFISALKSKKGASFKLLSLIGGGSFEINLSVPLVLEYEDVAKRSELQLSIDQKYIDDILDYLCQVANRHDIFFLWRPFLKDPKNDLVLELAVKARGKFILTYNLKDFNGIDQFGIQAITPKEFLEHIGE